MIEIDKSIEKMEGLRRTKRDNGPSVTKDNEILFVVAKAAMQVLHQFENTSTFTVQIQDDGDEVQFNPWGDFLDIMAAEGFDTQTVTSFKKVFTGTS